MPFNTPATIDQARRKTTTQFTIKVLTSDNLEPNDVVITDSDGALGTWRRPLVITTSEFLELFESMSVLAEKLLKYRALMSGNGEGRGLKGDDMLLALAELKFNDRWSESESDAMSLFFKKRRLEHAYSARFKETCARVGRRAKWQDRISAWNSEMYALYRKLLLDTKEG